MSELSKNLSFVDSHCHLNFPDFEGDRLDMLERAKHAQVCGFLNICTKVSEVENILEFSAQHDNISATIGIHPHEASETWGIYGESLRAFFEGHLSNPVIVGLGETGLDYYYENSQKDHQEKCFRIHCELSLEHKLPLIIHTRDADEDTIRILKDYPGVQGVLHCFSGSQQLADEALALGLSISVSGIATFKSAEDLRSILKSVPLNRLLIETDAPYLAPIPFRGKRNEPAFVVETAKKLAELMEVNLEVLAQATTQNFKTLFQRVSW